MTAEELARLVGRRVRQLRVEKGWQQADLEAYTDSAITRSAVSYLENGRIFPSARTWIALAEALEVQPAVLLLDPEVPSHRAALASLTACQSEPE